MKSVNFKWAWGDHDPKPDQLMTRERAAKLLRAWRRSKSQGRKVFTLRRQIRDNKRFYIVNATHYRDPQDAATLIIE